jgi:hypothetical protein
MDVREASCEDGKRIALAQDDVQWQADLSCIYTDLVNTAFKYRFQKLLKFR